jgi:hypothetical protein
MENPLADVGMRMGGAGLPPDPTAGLLQTAAELVTLSWQDFAYPMKWAAPDTSKTRMQYGNHRNRLLKAIAHTSPSTLSLEMARKDYAAARAQFDQDPRLDYAFGLVLWKHEQYSEAIEMFQTAARLDGVPFLPAALAVAWGRFLVHDERRGLDQLAHVARLLASSATSIPPWRNGNRRQCQSAGPWGTCRGRAKPRTGRSCRTDIDQLPEATA